jgi:GntR family transcriptional regulator
MVTINKTSSKPYYEQLILSIKEDILHGILQPGDRIPSVREMAKQLLMNPNTVSKAYKVLESEQVLITIKGKGTFVKTLENVPRDDVPNSTTERTTKRISHRSRASTS